MIFSNNKQQNFTNSIDDQTPWLVFCRTSMSEQYFQATNVKIF